MRLIALLTLIAAVSLAGAARAVPIEVVFEFPDGFEVSLNGAPAAPSGALTFRALLDSAAPDLSAVENHGVFAVDSIRLSAPALGLLDEALVAAAPALEAFGGGFSLWVDHVFNAVGWNGGPGAPTLMADPDDLGTLPLPTAVATSSTFFGGPFELASGDVLDATIGSGGAPGLFSATLVPEPSKVLLLVIPVSIWVWRRGWDSNPRGLAP